MARNIEIKARAGNFAAQSATAFRIADGPPLLLEQEDTFFHARTGRLKLREFGDGTGELIQYDRPDAEGPKTSSYIRSPTNDPVSLKEALSRALGIRAVVSKRRTVLLTGQTRIHLDSVTDLGNFLELEVVLRPDQAEAEGIAIAERLMGELGIGEDQLISGAYVDLMNGSKAGDGAEKAD